MSAQPDTVMVQQLAFEPIVTGELMTGHTQPDGVTTMARAALLTRIGPEEGLEADEDAADAPAAAIEDEVGVEEGAAVLLACPAAISSGG